MGGREQRQRERGRGEWENERLYKQAEMGGVGRGGGREGGRGRERE